MNIQTQTFTLPAHWGSYFINGDMTGYEDDELDEIQQWERDFAPGPCIDMGEAEFTWRGDEGPLGADRAEFTFQVADWF